MQAVNVDVEVYNKQSLGLTFLKPVNDSNRGIVINSVTKGGQCDGKVLKGEEIIYIDGVALHNITTISEFIKLFKKSSNETTLLTIRRIVKVDEGGEKAGNGEVQVQMLTRQQKTEILSNPDGPSSINTSTSVNNGTSISNRGNPASLSRLSTTSNTQRNSRAAAPQLTPTPVRSAATVVNSGTSTSNNVNLTPSRHPRANIQSPMEDGQIPENDPGTGKEPAAAAAATAAATDIFCNVVLKPGKLGLTIKGDKPNGIEVQGVNETSQCKGKIAKGDYIVAINDSSLQNATLKEFMAIFGQLKDVTRILKVKKGITAAHGAAPTQQSGAVSSNPLSKETAEKGHAATNATAVKQGVANAVRNNANRNYTSEGSIMDESDMDESDMEEMEKETSQFEHDESQTKMPQSQSISPKEQTTTPNASRVVEGATATGNAGQAQNSGRRITSISAEKFASSPVFEVVLKPGPLGIQIVREKPYGLRVNNVNLNSQCRGKLAPGDWLVSIDENLLHYGSVADFKEYVGRETNAPKVLKVRKCIPGTFQMRVTNSRTPTSTQPPSQQLRHEGNTRSEDRRMSEGSNIQTTEFESEQTPARMPQAAPVASKRDIPQAAANRTLHRNAADIIDQAKETQKEAPKEQCILNDPKGDSVGKDTDGQMQHEKQGEESSSNTSTAIAPGTNVPNPPKASLENNPLQTSKQKINSKESSSAVTQSKDTSKERCDICGKGDNYLGHMNMQTCSVCKISVHETCYGLNNSFPGRKHDEWKCHACASIGKVLKLKKKDGGIREVHIKSRAKRCALCPIFKGNHAMHPLFDKAGKTGQPIVAKKKHEDEGIVWVHTLCALVLNSNIGTNGLVYGCLPDGTFGGDDDDDDDDDDDANKDSQKPENSTKTTECGFDLSYYGNRNRTYDYMEAAPNHFVIVHEEKTFLQRLADFRELSCQVCKHDDRRGTNRIPMQCSFEDCQAAIHVGCAQWGLDEPQIDFFPGLEDDDGNELRATRALGFCKEHYKHVRKHGYKMTDDEGQLEAHGYESVNKTNTRASSKFTLDDDGDGLFDYDFGHSSDEDEHHYVDEFEIESNKGSSKKRPRTGDNWDPKKRHKLNQRTSQQHNNLNQKTAYQEKKELVEKYSPLMISDLERKLKDGKPYEKARDDILRYYRGKLPLGVFKQCKEGTEEEFTMIENSWKNAEKRASSNEEALDHPTHRWSNLFVPDYIFGSILSETWEECGEISQEDVEF